jgi:hypothetical protein
MLYQKRKVKYFKIFRVKIVNGHIGDLLNKFKQYTNKIKICLTTIKNSQKPSINANCQG